MFSYLAIGEGSGLTSATNFGSSGGADEQAATHVNDRRMARPTRRVRRELGI
jgi:hypothetical protein